MKNTKYGKRREGRWTPIWAKVQDTRANSNSWEIHLARKRWDIGLIWALSLRIMMMMYVCMYVRMYVCTYVCMYVCMYVCKKVMYVCMYVCVCMCVGKYVCSSLMWRGGALVETMPFDRRVVGSNPDLAAT